MPVESLLNNKVAGNLFVILKSALRKQILKFFRMMQKLRLPNKKTYFYPDPFVSTEIAAEENFIAFCAVFIAEVLSDSTRSYNAFDKFFNTKKLLN